MFGLGRHDFLWDSKRYDNELGALRTKFVRLRESDFQTLRETWAQTFEQFRSGIPKDEIFSTIIRLRNEISALRTALQQLIKVLQELKTSAPESTRLSMDCGFALKSLDDLEESFRAYEEWIGRAVDCCRYRSFDEAKTAITHASLMLGKVSFAMRSLEKDLSKPLVTAIRTNLTAPVSPSFAKPASLPKAA